MEAGFSGQLVLSGVVVMVVGILVLDGCGVADGAVAAVRVEPVHPAACGEFEVIDGVEWAVVADAFRFVEPVRALSEGVVIRISDGPDRRERSDVIETTPVDDRGVLAASVAVMDDAGDVLTVISPDP